MTYHYYLEQEKLAMEAYDEGRFAYLDEFLAETKADLKFTETYMKCSWENRHLLARLAGLPLDEERVFKLIQKELGDDHEIVKSIKKENPSLQNSSHGL